MQCLNTPPPSPTMVTIGSVLPNPYRRNSYNDLPLTQSDLYSFVKLMSTHERHRHFYYNLKDWMERDGYIKENDYGGMKAAEFLFRLGIRVVTTAPATRRTKRRVKLTWNVPPSFWPFYRAIVARAWEDASSFYRTIVPPLSFTAMRDSVV